MSTPYKEISDILRGIENEFNLPPNTLKNIYDAERKKVFMGYRTGIITDLKNIINSCLTNSKEVSQRDVF